MRPLTLLLFLVLAPCLIQARAEEDRTAYFLVKTWRLTGTWSYTKHFQNVKVEGDITTTHTYDAEVWARAQFRMVQAKSHSSKRYRWQLEKGFKPITEASIRIVDFTLVKPKHFPEAWTKTEITLGGNALEGDGRLDIEPEDGACRVVAGFMSVPGEMKITNSQGGNDKTESPFYFSSGALECMGQASGMNFGGFSPDAICSVPRERPDQNPIHFKWQVAPWEQEPEGEATFDLVSHDWLPEPDSTCGLEVKWKGKAEQVKVTLSGISREPGTCLNSVDTTEDEDFVIEKQGQWEVQKEGSRDALKYIAYRILPKNEPPQSVNLDLKAKDYGAYGKIACEVLLDGKWREAKSAGGQGSLNVPYDANDNHIADAWEKQEGVTGCLETWDQAEVEGQTAKGDGLSLYAKYRGLRTVEKGWTRLVAKEKVHFVLDAGGVFDTERWLESTGIRAYKVSDDMVQGGKVDFNARTAAGEGKYSVRLELMPGTSEQTTNEDGDVKTDNNPKQYAYTNGRGSPRTTEACRIFPDRIRGMVHRVSALVQSAATDPVLSPTALEERALLLSLGFPMAEIKARAASLNEGLQESLAQQVVALCAIHEMGHACGVPGHLDGSGGENELIQRTQSCPSQYMDLKGRRFFILRGVVPGNGSFCRAAPDNCWSYLSVKD